MTAKLASVVVLPSTELGLVTCRILSDRSKPMNWIEVRSVRYASAATDRGDVWAMISGLSLFFQPETVGIRPRTGRPWAVFSRSSLDLIVSS